MRWYAPPSMTSTEASSSSRTSPSAVKTKRFWMSAPGATPARTVIGSVTVYRCPGSRALPSGKVAVTVVPSAAIATSTCSGLVGMVPVSGAALKDAGVPRTGS